jgi:hypothetical protein
LHADQDGDDLTILYLKDTNAVLGGQEQAAILELLQNSWKYGRRHGFNHQSRYKFTQYHRYLLYLLKNEISSPLFKAAGQKIMELGTSTHYAEFDEFVAEFYDIVRRCDPLLVNAYDLMSGEGLVEAVVKSGAKGSKEHIRVYLDNLLKHQEIPQLEEEHIRSFDRYIEASNHIGTEGAKQFTLLYAMNSIYMMGSNVYSNNRVLMRNALEAQLTKHLLYNQTAVKHTLIPTTTA